MRSKFIPLSVPNLKGNELRYATNAIETEWVSSAGKYVDDLESLCADYVNIKGAVACQSGTAGLHIALMLCGVTREDEVIVPSLTFIAAVNPVRYIGAEPIFLDCDDTLSMDADKLEEFCSKECFFDGHTLTNNLTNKIIKAIVVVHVFGNMANMAKILEVTKKYNLKVIEDATEAIGTYYTSGSLKNKYAGTMGDIGVFSLNGNKIITSGGGGIIVSDNEKYLQRAKYLTTQAKNDEIYYIHDEIGYNYRMTNVQAAIGFAQLEQLEKFIEIKIKNYQMYKAIIKDIDGLSLVDFREDIRSNHWFYSLVYDDKYPLNRDEIIKLLHENKIQSRPIWGLINQQKPYVNCQAYKIEKSEFFYNKVVNIPCSTNLLEEDLLAVGECLKRKVRV